MKRLAFLTPLPPQSTGIADYSAEVLPHVANEFLVDVFHDQESVEEGRVPTTCEVHPVSEFLPRHAEEPYDLAVYQMGNGPTHAFLYEFLARVPGLLVLHDLALHHSRARSFLDSPAARAYAARPDDASLRDAAAAGLRAYEEETAYVYPEQAERLAAAHLGTVGALLPYAYPLFRIPVEASRLTAVHNRYMAHALRSEVPQAAVTQVVMPMERVPVPAEAVRSLRARHGIAPDELVVGVFGLLTPEKRIETVARAVARATPALPRMRLLLVGPVPGPRTLIASLQRLGVAARTIVTGRVPFESLPVHLEAADLVVHLRYPTARETSAALLRVLAQGRPTLMADLEHLADVPEDAVHRVDMTDEEGEVMRAILRLSDRPAARERLGQRAREFVAREHSPARCRESYFHAIAQALSLPNPPARPWPAHWVPASGT